MIDPEGDLGAARRAMAQRFAAAGFDDPATEAKMLVLAVLEIGATDLLARAGSAVGPVDAARLEAAAAKRLAGMPIGRIVARADFAGLSFALSPDTLEPRDDTETLVRAVLDELSADGRQGEALRILDLGTGTGAILVALLAALPAATGFGVDRAFGAAATAAANAARNGVEGRALLWCGDWAEAVSGAFDIVVSNPPYIASAIVDGLDREVREHDPRLALDGGADGLYAYRRIVPDLARLLVRGGIAALEIGYDQAEAVSALIARAGLPAPRLVRDLGGRPRVLMLRAAGQPKKRLGESGAKG